MNLNQLNLNHLEQLRQCCRDEAAFRELKKILANAWEIEPDGQSGAIASCPNSPNPDDSLSFESWQKFLSEAGDLMIIYDPELRCRWMNAAGLAKLKLSAPGVVGKSNEELFGENAAAILVAIHQSIETQENVLVDCEIFLAGKRTFYNTVYIPIQDQAGKIAGVMSIWREVLPGAVVNWYSGNTDALTQTQAHQYKTLSRAIARIRESLDLETIFQATATEVRNLLEADRVAVFQFVPESRWTQGTFIAEDVNPEFVSVLGVQLSDRCFGEEYAIHYQRDRIQAVEDIYKAGFSECHIQLLAPFQIIANLIIPLLKGQELWGLLCIHQCSRSRRWKSAEIDFVTQIAVNLGVALQHTEYLEQLKAQSTQLARAAEREKAIATTVEKIRRSLDIEMIFATTTEEVRLLLNADRVGVFRFHPDWSGEFVGESVADGWQPLVGQFSIIPDTYLQETQGGRYRYNQNFAVDDIYQAGHSECHLQLLEQFQAKAYAIVPIWQGEKLWGLLAAYQNAEVRHWEPDEVELLAQISAQLGVALQQAQLLEQTRRQAQELAATVENLQETQTQLIQSEKLASLGQLVAGIAHEINNPVNFIYGNLSHAADYTKDLLELLQIYQQYYPTTPPEICDRADEMELEFLMEDLPKILSSMKVGADRIRQLVLSLRNFSRLDEAERKAVDLHEGIDSTILILQHRLKGKTDRRAIVAIKEYAQLPPVECYAAQLNQVFMNILSNAIDALEEVNLNAIANPEQFAHLPNPTIWIRTAVLDPERISVRISDNGPGMPAAVRSRIFEPFFTTKPIGAGTGLGLSISYQIVVEKHGGVLQCFSQPGEGTEFYIEIPIKQSVVKAEPAKVKQ